MKAIICIEDNNGLMFNKRRLSRDKEIVRELEDYLEDEDLVMNESSAVLFEDSSLNIRYEEIDETSDDYYFIEDNIINEIIDNVTKLIIFKWNRRYPSDIKFNAQVLKEFKMKEYKEFAGNSHELLTMEVYYRK